MKKIISKIGVLAVMAIALSACYPGGAEYTSDTDIVITDYNEDYNFSSVETYYLDDEIYHIVDDTSDIDRSNDAFIIGELARNFDNLGWERLDSTDAGSPPPDVSIVVSQVQVTNVNVYYNPWYWGWGGGWYWKSSAETNYWGYPGYGWGYPWYGGGTYYSSYEVGTVFWRLFDPEDVDEEAETVNVSWLGVVNGLLGSSKTNTAERVTRGIDQAFTQSPYLSE